MPLYPYRCTSCGHRFEKIQSFSSEPEKVCPNCGKETLVRPLTAPRFQFKGSGWYINDYAPKGGSEGSSETSTESKPAESKDAAKTADAPSESGTASAPATPAPAAAPAPSSSTLKSSTDSK
ncbi:FmdB family zinc ribbon protein [Occallatibacter savannae]|uniref:FmdB family zinc ribbon protein n=1 Tax=Occallatibacter savannae TaxID=1002691 RepID=UPI000D688F7A|nr:zinc ribbon domain-containing protein [Occallatibacter savannae]